MKWSSSSGSLCRLWGHNEWRSCRSLVDIDVHPKDGIGIHPGYDHLWYLHIKEPGYSARWLMLIPYRSPGSGLPCHQASDGFLCCSSVKVASLPAVQNTPGAWPWSDFIQPAITSYINIIQPSTLTFNHQPNQPKNTKQPQNQASSTLASPTWCLSCFCFSLRLGLFCLWRMTLCFWNGEILGGSRWLRIFESARVWAHKWFGQQVWAKSVWIEGALKLIRPISACSSISRCFSFSSVRRQHGTLVWQEHAKRTFWLCWSDLRLAKNSGCQCAQDPLLLTKQAWNIPGFGPLTLES